MKRSLDSRIVGLVWLSVMLVGLSLSAGEPRPFVDQAVERLAPEVIEIRHRIHQNPELGNREFETSRLVADYLGNLGLVVQTGIAHTGVIGLLQGGRPGPVVALRADMDALPVVEQTDLPFRSTKRTVYLGRGVGVAHACGHDIHTSVLLGVASVLATFRDQLAGAVKLIFQPAEEGPPPGERGGAELMLEEGALANPRPEAILAFHSDPSLEVGQVGYIEGPSMAAVDHFLITIRGEQAHGANPHLAVDPIVLGSQVVSALQTIRSRNLPPLEPSVVTVGMFHGGERFNIIPAEVRLEGTVRTFDEEIRRQVERRMLEILEGITLAGGGSYKLDYRYLTPAVINDTRLARFFRPTLQEVLESENVIEGEPLMPGEDFAYFANEVPGFHFRLGVVEPGGSSGGLHTPTFKADDGAVEVGMRVVSHLVLSYLQDHASVAEGR